MASAPTLNVSRVRAVAAVIGSRWRPAVSDVAHRLRVSRTLGRGRLLAAVACALLLPIALVLPALVALTLVAAVWVALHAYEINLVAQGPRADARAGRSGFPFLNRAARPRPSLASRQGQLCVLGALRPSIGSGRIIASRAGPRTQR